VLAVNINLVASRASWRLVGQVFALFVLTVAAGEAGRSACDRGCLLPNRGSIAVEDHHMMKG